jgi:uncharacterized surface protein with fasciclin (FAS1) repeats
MATLFLPLTHQSEFVMNITKSIKGAFLGSLLALGSITTVSAGDIVDTAVSAGSFNTLVTALKTAGLVNTLKGDGPFTVFAPTDEAFAALPEGTVENLLKPENKDKLISILTYHVVPGKVMSSDVNAKQLNVATVQGSKVFINGMSGVSIDNAKVIKANIETSNGVIHVIDSVILPKS